MANKAPTSYRKLPGYRLGLLNFSTVWQGDSHLLLVIGWPSGESYRRFFYADIQAIVIRRTAWRLVANLILGAILVGFSLPLAMGVSDSGLQIFCGIVAGICLIFVLVNSLLGPTCVMQIQTAIQTEKLPNVARQRAAQNLVARLQPLIQAAQAGSGGVPSPAENP